MSNIREISGRIRSIQDTMKITNAMYMISSTKLRKARNAQEGNAPYFKELQDMTEAILTEAPEVRSVYLEDRPEKTGKERKRAVIVVTADKGLAGAYNSNVLKLAYGMISEDVTCKFYVVGEVGRQYFASKKVLMAGQFKYTAQNPTLNRARVIADVLLEDFRSGEIDEICIVYTQMKTAVSSEAVVKRLLPIERRTGETAEYGKELHFASNPADVLNNIVPDVVVGYIYSALAQSFCSEQNDRMMAMDSANKNAEAMIHSLSIELNRMRQAMITQEITEVVAGAKAQKKKRARKEAAALERSSE